jgi:uncharacterized protein (DUF1697 family)
MRIAVITRTQAEFQRAIDNNPFLVADFDVAYLHIMFFSHDADIASASQIAAGAFLPDQFAVMGCEVYLYLPTGVARSKLPIALGSKLGKGGTMRNWRTATTLLSLMNA